MERIKQILTDNVSYITVAELNYLLERKDNLNPQESFMLGVNVGRSIEKVIKNYHYTLGDVDILYDFIESMMQEKPAIIKKDLKDTVREYIEELNRRCIVMEHDGIRDYVYGLIKELRHILGDFENSAGLKNALNQTEKEAITENHRLTKYP